MTVVVTATPPPVCAQVSQSNLARRYKAGAILLPHFDVSYRVSNVCHRKIYFEPTVILYDASENIMDVRTYTGSFLRSGQSKAYTKSHIRGSRSTEVKSYEIEMDWRLNN